MSAIRASTPATRVRGRSAGRMPVSGETCSRDRRRGRTRGDCGERTRVGWACLEEIDHLGEVPLEPSGRDHLENAGGCVAVVPERVPLLARLEDQVACLSVHDLVTEKRAHASLEELALIGRIGGTLGVAEDGVAISWRRREKPQPPNVKFRIPADDAPNLLGATDLGFPVRRTPAGDAIRAQRWAARRVTAQEAAATPPATANTAGQAPTFLASGCDPAKAAT